MKIALKRNGKYFYSVTTNHLSYKRLLHDFGVTLFSKKGSSSSAAEMFLWNSTLS